MPDPLAHVYDLALRALAEQERRVTALHGRLAPVLAAGGLAATLLAPPAFRGDRPAGGIATAGLVLGLVGVTALVLAAVYVLLPRELSFGLNASSTRTALHRVAKSGPEAFYSLVIAALDELRAENARVIRWLDAGFTVMLCGMLVEVCGLATAVAVG